MPDMKKASTEQNKARDWQKTRSAMEETVDKLMDERARSVSEKENILRTRAEKLAREEADGREAEEHLEIVQFRLDSEDYGIEIEYVREVKPLNDITPLPGTPQFIMGLINHRGRIRTVIDVKKFFDLPEKVITELNRVILVQAAGMEVGILADAVQGIRSVPVSEVQKSLPVLTDNRAEYTRGVTNRQVVILDIGKILSDPRIIVDEHID
jgi:purine-binding chemotaxis protein CheW